MVMMYFKRLSFMVNSIPKPAVFTRQRKDSEKMNKKIEIND